MNIPRLNDRSKEQLTDFIIGNVIKTFIIYKTDERYKASVDQPRNHKRASQTVSKSEFPAPTNVRDEVFKKFNIYNNRTSPQISRCIHKLFLSDGVSSKCQISIYIFTRHPSTLFAIRVCLRLSLSMSSSRPANLNLAALKLSQ